MRDYDRRWSQPTDEQAQELGSLELLLLNQQQDTPWTYAFRAGTGQWHLYSSNSRGIPLQEALNTHNRQ